MSEAPHHCAEQLPEDGPGPAIDSCDEIDGVFWVGNGEYGSAVRFCPFCGVRAPRDPKDVPLTTIQRASEKR